MQPLIPSDARESDVAADRILHEGERHKP